MVNGDAGKIVVWADEHTEFYGSASASAFGFIGAGGFVETSGVFTLRSSDSPKTYLFVSGILMDCFY